MDEPHWWCQKVVGVASDGVLFVFKVIKDAISELHPSPLKPQILIKNSSNSAMI